VLGISDKSAASIYEAAAGPLYRKALKDAVGSTLDAAAKEALAAVAADLSLPESVVAAITAEAYNEALEECTGEGKIMDEEQAGKIRALRDFLGLSFDDVEPAHAKSCSAAYAKSVQDVIGGSGAIPEEYFDGLESLRERLGLGEETAAALFATVAKRKMKEFGVRAGEAIEAKAKEQQQGDAKPGEKEGSIGIEADAGSALCNELTNLIEFATSARVLLPVGEGAEQLVAGATLRDQFESRMLKELYRQFLVEAFSGAKPALQQKILTTLPKLALVLGLEENEVGVVHDEIGGMIYRQYLTKAFKKGPLGPDDRNFLGSIQSTLGLEQGKCDDLVRGAAVNRVSIMIEKMFESSTGVVAAEVRAMRDSADELEVDLVDDAKVGDWRLERMFLVELEDLIDSGELTPDDTGALEELCEPMHVSEADATRMLEETVAKRTSSGLLQAAALLRQEAHQSAVKELERMLKYAALVPQTVASSVSATEKQELFLLFQANSLADGKASEETTAKLDLFQLVIGTKEAA